MTAFFSTKKPKSDSPDVSTTQSSNPAKAPLDGIGVIKLDASSEEENEKNHTNKKVGSIRKKAKSSHNLAKISNNICCGAYGWKLICYEDVQQTGFRANVQFYLLSSIGTIKFVPSTNLYSF